MNKVLLNKNKYFSSIISKCNGSSQVKKKVVKPLIGQQFYFATSDLQKKNKKLLSQFQLSTTEPQISSKLSTWQRWFDFDYGRLCNFTFPFYQSNPIDLHSDDPKKSFNKPWKDHETVNKNEKEESSGDDPNNQTPRQFPIVAFSAFVITALLFSRAFLPQFGQETSWPVFLRLMLQTGEVEKLEVFPTLDRVNVYLAEGAMINGREVFGIGPHYTFSISSVAKFEERLKNAQEELGIKSSEFIPVKYNYLSNMHTVVNAVLTSIITLGPLALLYFLFRRGMKSGRMFGGGGSPFTSHTRAKATVIIPGTRKGIRFEDVAGMQEAKQEVMEFVDYLEYPARFKELGAKIPKGALLCGPPGTGKTLLAKAVATEAGVPFISMAGSDFVEMFSGVGSARVRDLFAQAREKSPCIVYIDEIDAIGKSRRSSSSFGGNSEQENTLNQLLVEMDGMNTVEGVVMLASTNRPDILDQALLRPGRFDRTIQIDLPTLLERKDIFEIYLKELKLGGRMSIYSQRLAELTPGKSGADIANICNEAALHAARLNEKRVDTNNFEHAIERVIAGIQKKTNPLSPEERRTIAYHEAGHAIVSWMLKYTEPVLKISVIPRTNSPLGYTQKFPLDIKLQTNEQLFDLMCSLLGGRVAEAMIFDRITTGAEDDLKKVTNMAYQQIVTFGMNQRIGPISFQLKKQNEFTKKPYSDKLAKLIDEEASNLIAQAHEKTREILTEHRDKLEILAEKLIEKEVVNHDEIIDLIGQSPHGDKRKTFYKNAFKSRDENVQPLFT